MSVSFNTGPVIPDEFRHRQGLASRQDPHTPAESVTAAARAQGYEALLAADSWGQLAPGQRTLVAAAQPPVIPPGQHPADSAGNLVGFIMSAFR